MQPGTWKASTTGNLGTSLHNQSGIARIRARLEFSHWLQVSSFRRLLLLPGAAAGFWAWMTCTLAEAGFGCSLNLGRVTRKAKGWRRDKVVKQAAVPRTKIKSVVARALREHCDPGSDTP